MSFGLNSNVLSYNLTLLNKLDLLDINMNLYCQWLLLLLIFNSFNGFAKTTVIFQFKKFAFQN